MNFENMMWFLFASIVAVAANGARANVYDDVSYWYRGVYNSAASNIPQLDNRDEFVNALYVNLAGGHGRITSTDSGDRTVGVAGERKNIHVDEIMDVAMPYAGRIQKNRSPVHLVQPTYKNPGDDTLYGYSNYIDVSNPFCFNNTNAYSIVCRLKHESYIVAETQEATFLNAGYGWGVNSGFWASLKGDPTNLYVYVYLGGTGSGSFTACQAKESTHLSTNKWIDMAFVFDPKVGFTVYTCPEDGELCSSQIAWKSTACTRNYSWIRLGTGEQNGNSSATNVAATSSSIVKNFRGWFDQLATWPRALTADEVKEAFSSGFRDGDAIRFGVANDLSCEFYGYNKIAAKAVTVTSADLHTDWRYFPSDFNAATNTATVKFGPMRAADYRRALQLSLTTTSDSAAGARMTVALNGKAILTGTAVEPGTTQTASVAYADLLQTENSLVFTRTDSAGGDLRLDTFAIEAIEASEPTVSDLGKISGDVWSGAYAWWKKAIDADGDGKFKSSSDRLVNQMLANPAFTAHGTHRWNLDGAEIAKIVTTDVVCPATGETLEDESCVYFAPGIWAESGTGRQRFNRADLYQSVFPITNNASYAWMIRFKVAEIFDGQKHIQLAGCGYGWSASTGSAVDLKVDANGPENMAFSLPLGYITCSSTYPQTLAACDHLAVGKWIDFGLSCSNGNIRVYYAVEGGSGVVEIPYVYTYPNWKTPSSSKFVIGLEGTDGSTGEYGTNTQAKVYYHQAALWPHWLNGEEMAAAFAAPRPNILQSGITNGNDNERETGIQETILSGAPLVYACDVTAEDVGKNQFVRLRALPGFDPNATLSVTFDGTLVTNVVQGSVLTSFLPNAEGVYEVGVRKELLDAAGAHELRLYTSNGEIAVDSLIFGTFGRKIRVKSKICGMAIILR